MPKGVYAGHRDDPWPTTPRSTVEPTSHDIAWAAGIYEGEGHIRRAAGTAHMAVVQKDTWLLKKLQKFFGGNLHEHDMKSGCSSWNLNGRMATDFMVKVYPYLSPRRKHQAAKSCVFDKLEVGCA